MKNKNITLENLYDKAYKYENFSCKPAYCRKYKIGTIFDEEKSVKWNREEVERKNFEFENAVKQLNREKNLLYTELISMINSYITVETGVSVERSEKIWNYLYSNYHAYGLAECLNHLDELLELFL